MTRDATRRAAPTRSCMFSAHRAGEQVQDPSLLTAHYVHTVPNQIKKRHNRRLVRESVRNKA